MKNTFQAKTMSASLPATPQDIFNRLQTLENPKPTRAVRSEHTFVIDLFVQPKAGVELRQAIRILPNGEGSEIVWTIVKADGIADGAFHEQVRWAGNVLQQLKKMPKSQPVESAESPEAAADGPLAVAPSAEAAPAEPQTGKKLFVGNLSYDWTDDELRAHFVEAGSVTLAEIARFRGRNGRSRGFGFVEMGSEEEAKTAIEKLHGGTAGGRQIIVRLAKSQEPRPAAAAAPSESQPPAEHLPTMDEDAQPASLLIASASDELVEDPDVPGPGNEKFPKNPPRRQGSGGPGRGGRFSGARGHGGRGPGARGPVNRSGGARSGAPRGPRTYQGQDFVNNSGYEIYPRRAGSSAQPVNYSAPSRPNAEASPYMEDTGDIENRGARRRPPRRRR